MTNQDDVQQTMYTDAFWAQADQWFFDAMQLLWDGQYEGALAFPFQVPCKNHRDFHEMCSRIGMHHMAQRLRTKNEELDNLGDDDIDKIEVSSHLSMMPAIDFNTLEGGEEDDENDDWDEDFDDDDDFEYNDVSHRD